MDGELNNIHTPSNYGQVCMVLSKTIDTITVTVVGLYQTVCSGVARSTACIRILASGICSVQCKKLLEVVGDTYCVYA